MAYRSLYLTYRPQTFEEVAGQRVIVETLKNALSSGKIAHAYLFAGPRGTGKTTMARLFAKALDCEEGVGKQCCKCSNCLAVAEGNHPDVIEIDAASNNGVDQVRDLIEKVKYSPIKGRYKVYIIDEVHMMSASAFNALLKTLEEPPENVIFILCTTEPFKVLPTILSRCQRFDFSKISDDELKALLVRVLTSEKSIYDEDGLKAIISLADGGARDALSLLDQVLSYSGNELHEKDVLTLFGLASIEEKVSLLESISNGDVSSLIARTNSYVSGGIDIRRLTGDLIEILKDLLIFERTKDASLLSSLDEANAKVLASSIDFYKATSMLNSFIKTQNDFKNVNDVRSLFEVTILELATSDTQVKEHATPIKPTPKPVVVPKEEVKVAPKEETIKSVENPVVEEKKEEKVQPASIITFEKPKEEVKPVIEPEPKVEEKTPISGRPSKEMFAAPPDFLFEEEKPAPKPVIKSSIDIAKILKPAIAVEGAQNEISDDEIVKIMVLADKAERTKLLKKWDEFASLKGDPKLGNLATLLSEGHPYCLAKEALILCFDFKRLRDKANIIENQEALEEMVEQLLGRKVFIYAIDPVERNRLSGTYFSLMQLGKMPKKSEIVLNLPNGKKEK